ncbi:MAG: hypothetical protein EAX81_04375 [Candidatus Thorarchaeota archaeon]|nr:hypothetical protein [Candidatus Thorarchaeota archaeon]
MEFMTVNLLDVAKASIANQFTAGWNMLRMAIDLVHEKKWHYSYISYHIIETAQFYMCSN